MTQSAAMNHANGTAPATHGPQQVIRRSVPVGAPQDAENSIELITNADGVIEAIEVICVCGERHRILCDYQGGQS